MNDTHGHNLNPLEGEPGAIEDGGENEDGEDVAQTDEYEELAKKYEQLKVQVEQYFDDENSETKKRDVPILKTPEKPIKEQWERHQATHTPYEAWCKHCLAARAIRHKHPSKGRGAAIVPDIENGKGPTKVCIEYMYLHERRGKYK